MQKFITLLLILIFSSCQNKDPMSLSLGKFILNGDPCKSIQFLDTEKIVVTKDCETHGPEESIRTKKLNGEVLDLYPYDLRYEIDSIDNVGGHYISAFDKNNNKCYGFHIIDREEYRVCTPLKSGAGIDFHFTSPNIYIKKNIKSDIKFNKKLLIQFMGEVKPGTFYLAYSQDNISNTNDTKSNVLIELNKFTNVYRTDYEIDPSFYAFKNYQIEYKDPHTQQFVEIPILYHDEFIKHNNMSADEKAELYKQKKIIDKFMVVYRFNPGRKRIVNKIYKKKIIGQVQTFQLVELAKESNDE